MEVKPIRIPGKLLLGDTGGSVKENHNDGEKKDRKQSRSKNREYDWFIEIHFRIVFTLPSTSCQVSADITTRSVDRGSVLLYGAGIKVPFFALRASQGKQGSGSFLGFISTYYRNFRVFNDGNTFTRIC
jgi:hypothetical protein